MENSATQIKVVGFLVAKIRSAVNQRSLLIHLKSFLSTKIITVNKATRLGQVMLMAQTPPLTTELTAGD